MYWGSNRNSMYANLVENYKKTIWKGQGHGKMLFAYTEKYISDIKKALE